MSETVFQKIERLQREIADRQIELQFLALNNPMECVTARVENVGITPEWRRDLKTSHTQPSLL